MYKYGKRTGVKGGARFKSGMTSCARCGSGALLQEHHVVYVQHLRQEGGDVTDSANALTLCADCHRKHHDRAHPVPLALLRDENYRFAAALYGPKSYDYLRRRYSGEDPRLDALLETA
ncbi:MAG TPA: HNH endonuclease [Longimicrobiales bacterium]